MKSADLLSSMSSLESNNFNVRDSRSSLAPQKKIYVNDRSQEKNTAQAWLISKGQAPQLEICGLYSETWSRKQKLC